MALVIWFVIRLRNLFAVVILLGLYSLLAATLFVHLDAVDVAFTEAAVGAGISTVLALGALALTTSREAIPERIPLLPLFIVLIVGAALIYASLDMPLYGDATAAAHLHVAPRYIARSLSETGVPNMVTAILASYRGFDTLGEVTVILTAAVGVVTILGTAVKSVKTSKQSSNQ
jgi:multicomponent Na+:H+ antiporter subunit B